MLIKAREKATQLLEKYADNFTSEHIKSVDYELGID